REVQQRHGHRTPLAHGPLYPRTPTNAETTTEARSQPRKREHGAHGALLEVAYRSCGRSRRCEPHTNSGRVHSAPLIPRSCCLPNHTWTGRCSATTLTTLAHVAAVQDSRHPTQAPDFSAVVACRHPRPRWSL